MAQAIPMQGVLRVVPPSTLNAALQQEAEAKHAASLPPQQDWTDLAAYIRTEYSVMKQHRENAGAGWNDRMLAALRAFNGQYDAAKYTEIKKFGGSDVYARLIAMKCRGAAALLRDVYLAPDRPWGIEPPADPDVPDTAVNMIMQLVQMEVQGLQQSGQPIDPNMLRDRVNQLMGQAAIAEKKQAKRRAEIAENRIEEILNEGGFYKALAEFLVDLPLFPFAVIKGPVVRIVPTVSWETGQAVVGQKPRMFWERVSPFDFFFTPGVSDIESASVVERTRLTRADLNDLLDLPGYNHDAIRLVLDEYGRGGLYDDHDSTDSERANNENRENPHFNRSGLINCIEFHGNCQGRMLAEYGVEVEDELRDYFVQAWLVGRHVIKVQYSPSPRKRHPYFTTSFEKMPGTPVGNGLPDILSDIQDVCNAALRSLVNNLSIASGPQVVVNDERLAADEDGDDLYPWKRWHTVSDPMGNQTQQPISFFQPQSNAQELLSVYQAFSNIADDISAIPKYQTGGGASGGAGRTAAGLAMLMGNASKLLQTVAANIDRDVIDPLLQMLFDMIMLTDQSGMLRGDEAIRVLGVNVATQRETQRSRQLEFLSMTANPMDMGIIGPRGRAEVLRTVAQTIGIDGAAIVPTDEKLEQMEMQSQQVMQAQAAQAQGGQQQGKAATDQMGPQVRIAGGAG